MKGLREFFERSQTAARVVPFVAFVALGSLQGAKALGLPSYYWMYVVKTVIGGFLLWITWPSVKELRWKISWEAIAIGVFVAFFWVALDPFCPKWFKVERIWDPFVDLSNAQLALGICIFHIVGSSIVVPPLEEAVFRSFIYRYIIKPDFLSVPLNQFDLRALIATSVIFGVQHANQWPAGILCGLCFQWLVLRKNRLGDAMTAHAIANFALGVWIVSKKQFQFW